MNDQGAARAEVPDELDGLRRRVAELETSRSELQRFEDALRQSSELHRVTLSSISDAVFITDGSGNLTFVSPSVSGVFGYSAEEAAKLGHISKLLGEVPFDPADLESLREIHNIEHEITDKAGHRRILLMDVKSVAIGAGRVLYTCRDITKRKQAQEQLRRSRDRLEDLVEERAAKLRASNEQLAQRNRLLSALSRVQIQFISEADPRVLYDRLLDDLLALTNSEFGLIGQVLHTPEGKPYLKTHAVTNIAWNDEELQSEDGAASVEFHSLNSLITSVMTSGKKVVVKDASRRRAAAGEGRPPLKSFLGLPVHSGKELIGMVGIANRPGGYDAELIDYLQPLLVTCGNIMEAHRTVQQRRQAEEELAKSERNFRNSIDSSPLGTSIVTRDGKLVYANQAFLDIYGYASVEQVKAVPLKQRYTPESYAQHLERKRRMKRGEAVPHNYELSIVRRDGEVRELSVFWDKVLWDGEPRFQVIYQDITELKRAEEQRRESEERFRLLFERSRDAIFLVDAVSGHCLDANVAAEGLTGRPLTQLREAPVEEVEPLQTLQRLHLGTDQDREHAEVTFTRPDGSERTALLTATPLNDRLYFGIARDITERKRAEERLQSSQASLANAQRIARLGSWDWDIRNNSFRLSEEAYGILQVSPEELGEPYEILSGRVHPEDRQRVQKSVVQALFQGKPFNQEYRILLPNGSEGVVQIRGEVTRDEAGKPLKATGTIQDITERRVLERKVVEYQELNQIKSNLLSTVSHELRTPLSIIKGYSTLLLDYDERLEQDEKREYLQSIDKATSRLAELVDHILDMSRLESGLLQLERRHAAIARLAQEAVAEAQLRAPGHSIVLNLPDELPKVNIDAKRIRQVMDNILDNAIKYSAEGTEITVSVEQTDHELQVSISDQGIGIPARDLERVFDRMYRVEQRTAAGSGGVGLGLAICRGLVEAHGGRIWLESEEGKGTTCRFTLPL